MSKSYNPFIQIAKSFEGFVHSEEYYNLSRQKNGSKILCAIIVSIFLCLFSFGIRTATICNDKEIYNTINEMPNFTYENGTLTLDKRYESTSGESYILVDTDISYFYNGTNNEDYIDPVDIAPIIKETGNKNGITEGLFVSSSNLIMVNYLTGQIQQITFSELSSILHIPAFSKSAILSGYKNFITKWAVIIGLIYLPFRFGLLFLVSLFFCLLALVGKSITKSEDDFNTIYWIAFYINIAFVIIRTIIKTLLPIGGSMLNTLFFALFIFILLKTLKSGDPNNKPENNVSYNTYYPGVNEDLTNQSTHDNFDN